MTDTIYQAKAAYVKVAVGSAGGTRVARIIPRGGIIPDGVDAEALKGLVKRGLIEKVKAGPDTGDTGSGGTGDGTQAPHANAGEDKWREYATGLGIEVPADADKAKIRELVDAHKSAQS